MPNLWYLCTEIRHLNPSLYAIFVILGHPKGALDDVSARSGTPTCPAPDLPAARGGFCSILGNIIYHVWIIGVCIGFVWQGFGRGNTQGWLL